MIKGYIVKSGNSHLTKHLFWFTHKSDEDAYVFCKYILKAISYPDWCKKPTTLIPAIYDNGIVTIAGNPQPFGDIIK